MSDDIAISVQGVTKAYRIWNSPASRLVSPAWRAAGEFFPGNSVAATRFHDKAASHYRDFWALKDISFNVKKGESLGIIGRNGSGKSTLLQLIAGTLQPTTGSIKLNGRVAALLELGSGFNPEFTGRENVYLNGAVLGLTRAEVDSRFDEIAAFADIGDFIDQPVKTFSSGMMIRLAFAVATCVQPDVLIVDEALSVGDVFFQQKCFKRIHALLESGVSLLFVSHDTAAVQNLCDEAVLLQSGKQIFIGPPEEATSRYFAAAAGPGPCATVPILPEEAKVTIPARKELREKILRNNILSYARSRHGAQEMEIVAAAISDDSGNTTLNIQMMRTLCIDLIIQAHRNIPSPAVGIHLYDRMNNLIFASGTRQLHKPLSSLPAGKEQIVSLKLTVTIQPGTYTLSLGCAEPSVDGPNQGFLHDRHEGLGPIHVYTSDSAVWPFYGIAQLPLEIEEL
jgi:lipopolysaccharide transport system ATP-binding protein